MARLYRPTIPVEIKFRVMLRQCGAFKPATIIREIKNGAQVWARNADGEMVLRRRTFTSELARLKEQFAFMLECKPSDLVLDHDPPLAARKRRGTGKDTVYTPDANDPDHLFYRPHGAEFEGSHLIKTNVRGDHGQHPDRVLIKKMRRLERGPRPKRHPGLNKNPKAPKRKWPSRPFPSSKGRK